MKTQQERRQQLAEAQTQLEQMAARIAGSLYLKFLKKRIWKPCGRSCDPLQRRMEALEPVNMLALEEYNRTQERLNDLSQKLTTLEEERTELLLRIETFTTLRRKAFQEAYDAVNINFQAIFAELSDGDGHLQLEDSEDPFNGGLNLVAHPKGKPVRRLASMSGGEKSLTALSFIFALQRYRPSPFYAFDEVDMFLDGGQRGAPIPHDQAPGRAGSVHRRQPASPHDRSSPAHHRRYPGQGRLYPGHRHRPGNRNRHPPAQAQNAVPLV